MHAVVNHLPIKPDADWNEMARRIAIFVAEILPAHPNVLGQQLIRVSAEEAVLVANFTDAAAMADFSSTVAGPWFAEHIRPFLAGPANRKTGEVVANFQRG